MINATTKHTHVRMSYCCAEGCQNGEGSGRSFFQFPRNPEQRKTWESRVGREGWRSTLTTVLCSDHFVKTDYEVDPDLLSSFCTRRQPRLKKDAVPSVFMCNKEIPTSTQVETKEAVTIKQEIDIKFVEVKEENCHTSEEDLQFTRVERDRIDNDTLVFVDVKEEILEPIVKQEDSEVFVIDGCAGEVPGDSCMIEADKHKKRLSCSESLYPTETITSESTLRDWPTLTEMTNQKMKKESGKYTLKKPATGGGQPLIPPKYDELITSAASLKSVELEFEDCQLDSLAPSADASIILQESELESHRRRNRSRLDYHRKKLSQRERIIGLKESGLSPTEIAKELGISRSTVYLWLKRCEEEGNLQDRRRTGMPRKTTTAEDEMLYNAVKANPFTNAEALKEQLHLNVSALTVRRRLMEKGINQSRFHFADQYFVEGLWGKEMSSRRKLCQRENIICMKKNGLTPTDIARELGISRTTVYLWLKRCEKEGNLQDHQRVRKSGKSTADEDELL